MFLLGASRESLATKEWYFSLQFVFQYYSFLAFSSLAPVSEWNVNHSMLQRPCISISFIHNFECPHTSLRQTIACRLVGRDEGEFDPVPF